MRLSEQTVAQSLTVKEQLAPSLARPHPLAMRREPQQQPPVTERSQVQARHLEQTRLPQTRCLLPCQLKAATAAPVLSGHASAAAAAAVCRRDCRCRHLVILRLQPHATAYPRRRQRQYWLQAQAARAARVWTWRRRRARAAEEGATGRRALENEGTGATAQSLQMGVSMLGSMALQWLPPQQLPPAATACTDQARQRGQQQLW